LEHIGGQQPKDWFKVVTILDILATRVRMPITELPAQCAAVVSIVRKMDTSEFRSWLPMIAEHATQLAKSLNQMDTTVPDVVSEASISYQERQVLGALDWQVEPATCETWISAFCARFNIVEDGSLHPSIQWVWQTSISYAYRICMWQPASRSLSPRCLAQGTFCISAVLAHLVLCENLRPDHMDLQDWLQLFNEVPNAVPVETQVVHVSFMASLLSVLETELPTIQENTHAVLMVIRDMNGQR